MRTLDSLRREAARATARRGHRMRWEVPWVRESRMTQAAQCRVCGAVVRTDTNPAPNDIDIGGEAVALNCRVRR